MLISDLPEDYKEKALSLQKEETGKYFQNDSNQLFWAFDWENSPQGYYFWNECDEARTVQDLPTLV